LGPTDGSADNAVPSVSFLLGTTGLNWLVCLPLGGTLMYLPDSLARQTSYPGPPLSPYFT